ncbi:hypothetical protein [Actinoplanes sp. NPDC049265]|uniref:hypothetical protein n=1 Tax=Actinoplanes sp. NPDC049265 TaxID=3363902 RepID=UPI003718607C
MAQWAVIIPADRWATERLYERDTLTVDAAGPAAGDHAVLVTDARQAVALGRFSAPGEITYIRRFFDSPVPAGDLAFEVTGPVTSLDAESYDRLAAAPGKPAARTSWLVSVAMPIEAATPAEAVRQFWTYAAELGPAELPAFVWPSGEDLAMQAFVLGAEANQDPEEEDD